MILSVDDVSFQGTARFDVVRRLGQGGMGVVYEAFDRERELRVALKTVREMSGRALVRLKNEFRALQDLQHPNLVALHELVEDEGRWFIIMELVEGVGFLHHVRPDDKLVFGLSTAGTGSAVSPSAATWQPSPARTAWEKQIPRTEGVFHEGRLRHALAQVVQGLSALHGGGKVHRDVKPGNIMVTEEGRVVLLDLGLVTGVRESDQSTVMHPVGTAGYMAPEQAASQRVGPPADWYSLGVVLYQALTGQLPFAGTDLQVMIDKQHLEPRPPSQLCAGLPADLDTLCCDLLRFAPADRPDGPSILRRLGSGEGTGVAPSSMPSSLTQTPPFIGRTEELEILEAAYQSSRKGESVVVLVEGESGVGKSALVRRFTDDLAGHGTVVLAGRCYERESVPYKGVDGVVDSLGRYLARLEHHEVAALLPRAAALLAQVFPVLRRVKAVANAPVLEAYDKVDPQEMRTRLFAALRELVARLADRRPLVLVIDDLQWAAADSLALISEILRPPDAPPLLAIAMMRSGTRLGTVASLELQRSLPADLRRIDLGRLSAPEAEELSARLLRRAAGTEVGDAARIAAEGGGHPLFIDELVRHVVAHGEEPGATPRLEDALLRRVADLPPGSRRVLELVAVAGRPVSQDVIRGAAGLDAGELASALGVLRLGNLAQARGTRSTDLVGVYHDRVREALVSSLDEEAWRGLHRELAVALEGAPRDDPEALAVHWREAGEPARAVIHALRAAAEAEKAFSFDHAARLYRMLLELQEGDDQEQRQIRVKLGDALSNAGRGAEAAVAYQDAASDAPPGFALELRRRAAEQLLRSGHVDQGLAAVEAVLHEIGMSLPKTPLRAMVAFLGRRALIRLRGYGFQLRDAGEVSSSAAARVDICFSLGHCLSMVDTIRGADFVARSLLMALQLGEPWRLARALATETTFTAMPGRPVERQVEKIMAVQAKVARQLGRPEGYAWGQATRGMAAYYTGRFRQAQEASEEAEELFRDKCTGTSWELTTVRTFLCWTLWYLGQVAEMTRRVRRHEAEALDRGDLYSVTSFRLGLLNTAWLHDDNVDEARRVARDAYERCSRVGASTQHWFHVTSLAQTAIYAGDGSAAHEAVLGRWPDLKRSFLLRLQLVRVEAWHLRARAALAAARETKGGGSRDALLRDTRRGARRIMKERLPWAQPLADLLLAGMAAARGHTDVAVTRAEAAVQGFEQADLGLYAAVARQRQGELVGGDTGKELTRAAGFYFEAMQLRRPDAWVAMLAPGF